MTGSGSVSVSVCVVVKDRRQLMLRCLDAIGAQDRPAGEVVVVDNGSTDGTFEALQQRAAADPRLRVVRDTGSLGRARNTAARTASGHVLAFTDSDCRPRPDWLRHGLVAFADDRVGVVQGRTVPEHAPTVRWSATQDIGSPTGLFEACNVLYRRDALLGSGGFDEEVGFFGEDTAAGWAVLRAGWREEWAGAAVVEHVVTTPGLGWHLRRTRGYANWPALIHRFPERREMLWHGMFLRRRTAEADAAVAGVCAALVTRRLAPALAAVPFAWRHAPRTLSRRALADSAGAAAFDLAISAALVRGLSAPPDGGAVTGPEVAVVIPTVDRVDLLGRCLRGLERQHLGGVEVVVVHDGDRGIVAVLDEWSTRLPLRAVQVAERGASAKRNAGWRTTTAPLVAFTDDDCEPAPGWLDALRRVAVDGAGLVAGPVAPHPGRRSRAPGCGPAPSRPTRPASTPAATCSRAAPPSSASVAST